MKKALRMAYGDYDPDQRFQMRWENHANNFLRTTHKLLSSKTFTDVSIFTQGGEIVKCHKIVLAANSDYFQELFMETPCNDSSVILADVSCNDMEKLIEFMYTGETTITQEQLESVLGAADYLKIKGLSANKNESNRNEAPPLSTPNASTTPNDDIAYSEGRMSPCNASMSSSYAQGEQQSPEKMYPNPWAAYHSLPLLESAMSKLQTAPSRRKNLMGSSYVKPTEKSPLSRKKRSSIVANMDDSSLLSNAGNDSMQLDNSCQQKNGTGSTHQQRSNDTSTERGRKRSDTHTLKCNNKPTIRARRNAQSKPKAGERKYKKYTQENIVQAIEAVDKGRMGALEAAKFYKIPSRTLYDKLKKAGVHPTKMASLRRAAKMETSSGAQFPYLNGIKSEVYGKGNDEEASDFVDNSIEESYQIRRDSIGDLSMDAADRSATLNDLSIKTEKLENEEEEEIEDLSLSKRTNNVVADISLIVQSAVAKKEEMDVADSKAVNES